MTTIFTEQQVRECTDRCLLIAHGKVYDATDYVSRHPGGKKSILKRAGADATVDFDFHRSDSWGPFLVGRLDSANMSDFCVII
jgi:cytochrome b involved in lipid metabolism